MLPPINCQYLSLLSYSDFAALAKFETVTTPELMSVIARTAGSIVELVDAARRIISPFREKGAISLKYPVPSTAVKASEVL